MNYRQALAWLYAMQRHGIKLGLENIQRLLQQLDWLKAANARVIHVAGTNGKGSVCAMADAICRAAGYRSGLFTSPHLISFRERIRVNGEYIPETETAAGLTRIRRLIDRWDPQPTFFEIATALGLDYFQRRKCQTIVLETGMGGRLDATNVVQPSVSVITPVDFDHEKWLGHSIGEIATEKAGIIKQAVPLVCAGQRAEAEAVIRRRAAECHAPVRFITTPLTKISLSLRGPYQRLNAALAVESVKAAGIVVSDKAIEQGLGSVDWPARFQIWKQRIVIDGAHNPAGAGALVVTWREQFDAERATVLLAILRDKNAPEIIQQLRQIATRFFLPSIRSERAMSPSDLAEAITAVDPAFPHSTFASTIDAISAAEKTPERILITGSLHFAGEALAILRGEPDALEECAQ